MAVLGRLLISSAERLDLPDLLSIDSYTAGDFQYLLQTFVGSSDPYVIAGFDVINPSSVIGTNSCAINIANSAMYYPGSGAGSFYYGLPTGSPNAQPLVPVLVTNATNYVYLTLTTTNTAQDTRAFWDPDANGQVGDEFTEEVNTESVIQVQVNVSTSAFPDNTVPVAIITMGATVISAVTDARPLMFRLGSGGQSPDPYNTFAWPALPTSSYERNEPPITITSGSGANPFQGGDKNILTFKQWMDAVMTKLLELGGTEYWYQSTTSTSVASVFHDALATTFKSKGQYQYSSSTPGQLTWTEDVWIVSVSDPRIYMLRSGTITIPDEDVAYIPLVREQPFNSLNQAVQWINGSTYVNSNTGSIGFFTNISQGDWVKKASDDPTLYLRVEQFYSGTNGTGSTTTAANAKSILLSGTYQGTSAVDIGVDDQGVYQQSNIQIQARNNIQISQAGGDFMWFAYRGDIVENISSISTTSVSGSVTTAIDSIVTVNATGHGLQTGDMITVTAPVAQAGTYQVNVIDTNNFTFNSTNTTTGAFTGYYGLVTTAATTNGYGLQIQNADHGCNTGDVVTIAGTTNYNGQYTVSVRSSTQLQFAIGASYATEVSGTSTLSTLDVRTEDGITRVVQGQVIDIGVQDSQNIQSYLGMPSLAVTTPSYYLPSSYNVLYGTANFNAGATDNITLRVSELTGMMADRAQDKTIKYLPSNILLVGNLTSGSNQQITFTSNSTPTLTIAQPGSPGNAVITLPTSAPGISLAAYQAAYVTINRNAGTTPSFTVTNIASVPVSENVFVIAERLGDNNIYLWDGREFPIGETPYAGSGTGITKVNLYDPVDTTLPTGSVTIDNVTVTAGMFVVFSNLSSGNNEMYEANGTGSTITGWTPQYAFEGNQAPSNGDLIIITQGQGFANQIGEFNGTTWQFNNVVRYFTGANYWEQSALITSTLTDNTINGTVFSVNYAGSQNMIVDYSLIRGSFKETGSLYVTTDGTNVSVVVGGANLNGPSGVTFSGTISGPQIYLYYTTTSTGTSTTMMYSVKRWSDTAGGPGGPPSYSGSGGSGVTSLNSLTGALDLVAGSNITITPLGSNITISSTGGGGGTPSGPSESIQYNNSGAFGGSANFLLDTTNNVLNLNGLNQSILNGPFTINNNVSSPATLFSYSASSFPYAIIEYSILRNGFYRVGRFLVANDTSSTGISDDYVETNITGVTLTASISGGNVNVTYTSTNTGFSGTFKYSMRHWS